jgi:transposase InsO family protein
MDGKGRALDNIYIERFWKTFNKIRIHQSLEYLAPDEKYYGLGRQQLQVA